MIKRRLINSLIEWKSRHNRKPLILKGARQTGKTFLLNAFGANNFVTTHYLNFEKEPSLNSLFSGDLIPEKILEGISFSKGAAIDRNQDLLILDEIQSCPRALTSLKYFCEEMPELAICAAGSLLGVMLNEESFPVGKVDFLDLYPLSFNEFLEAIGENQAIKIIDEVQLNQPLPEVVHLKLWELWRYYLITGGLPEAVVEFNQAKNDLFQACQVVRATQEKIINAYLADIAKHSGKLSAMQIERLWNNIPEQLGRSHDGSTKKFAFKDAVPGISGYNKLGSLIDWLESAGLAVRVPIINRSLLPLKAFVQENRFKLYLFDVGVLGALGELAPKTLLDFSFGTYKGYVAENFVLQELRAKAKKSLFSWMEKESEIEFILQHPTLGEIIPIEVKSGANTRSRSLQVYASKYSPNIRVILSARNISYDRNRKILYLPIYLASKLMDVILTNSFGS
jgi:predicted AAA+ superfamily ATPase